MSVKASPKPLANDFFVPLKARAEEVVRRYRAATPESARLFDEAKTVFPGGYSRDAIMRKPYPPTFRKGEGAVMTDADGRRIVDFWFNATSLPLGHADPKVTAAVAAQVGQGSAFFGMTENEVALARILCDRIPCAEKVRFTNSGSEAVMVGIRVARAATGRDLIIKFEGSYHGTYDDVYWSVGPSVEKAGDPLAPRPVPDTSGLPSGEGRVLVLPYNNPDVLERAMRTHGPRVAAVLVEPMANRMGLIMPDIAFLRAARRACDEHGAALLFDEVIALRIGYHGAQGEVGVTPDLATLGKIIGGGYPVGAVVGRDRFLSISEPDRKNRMAHAGTFNANPVTMVAGRATMEALTPDVFDRINRLGADVRRRLEEVFAGAPIRVTGGGSLFKINATSVPVRDYRAAATVDKEWENLASLHLLTEGFMMTPSLHGCVSTVTTPEHVDGLIAAVAGLARG